MKIIYDGTVLRFGASRSSSRSGIFFTACEMLSAFLRRKDVEVYLYADAESITDVYGYVSGRDELAAVRLANIRRCRLSGRVFAWLMGHAIPPERRRGVLRKVVFLPYLAARKIALKVLRLYLRLANRAVFSDISKACGDGACFLSPAFYPEKPVVESGLKRFTVLYDTIPQLFPQFFEGVKGTTWTQTLCDSLDEEDYGFAISEATKRDFLKFAPRLDAGKVTVIPLAAAERFHECLDNESRQAMRRKYGIPPGRRYFLSLCSIEPRKNLPFALKAFVKIAELHDDVVFVLAGGKWDVYSDQWERILSSLGKYRDRVVLPGYVDDADVAALYSDALAFVYISIYEGFGLPPLEAMQCGCPVLTSNTSSLPEVVGEAGLMVAPDDLEGAAAAMERLVVDEELRRDLKARGVERARMFNWDRTAAAMVDKMKERLSGDSNTKL